MYDAASLRWEIFRLDRSTEQWTSTEVPVDVRAGSLADVLWDGSHLYIASHAVTVSTDEAPVASKPGNPAFLYRYSYAGGRYVLDPGFPSTITSNSSESMTIDVDSTGSVWATWTQVAGSSTSGFTNAVFANRSSPGGDSWGVPFIVPVTGSAVAPDDISSLVRFAGNKIGILWSNQLDETVYWAVHVDGSPTQSWQGRSALSGNSSADDHLSIRSLDSDGQGRVFAAVKTSANDASADKTLPQLMLLVYRPSLQNFDVRTIATVGDCVTRPNVLLDTVNSLVRAYFTAPTGTGCSYSGQPGTIYEKTAPLDDPRFVAGRGIPVVRDGDSANMNDVTGTKQAVTSASGVVVLATNNATKRYWHADIPLGSAQPAAPVAQFSSSASSGQAPLAVSFTDASTGVPTSWSWDFGDGATSTERNPVHNYGTAGTFTVTLVATNAAGSGTSTRPGLVTVTAAPAGGSSSVAFRAASGAANTATTSVSVDVPSGAVTGDLLVAAVSVRGAPTLSPPAGWSLVRLDSNGTTSRTAVYQHRLSAGDAPLLTWRLSSAQAATLGVVAYSGVSSASPVDVDAGLVTSAAGRSIAAPSVTTTTAGDVVVGVFSSAVAATWTPPAGTTERVDVATSTTTYKVSQSIVDLLRPVAGATGTWAATASASGAGTGQLVALRPGS
ncbi:PKD domain-containing protein [Kineosporiaceae bacterium B12]|nr:PKD domain-containing protein [Kineococcus rubinsiae]